jgi:hypothetical protein
MKIQLKTTVDITATGTTHRKWQDIEYTDHAGQHINSAESWGRSRNQQRNWETVVQLLGLRTQPINLALPSCVDAQLDKVWTTTFEVETPDVLLLGNDKLALLKQDFEGVPIMHNLTETANAGSMFVINGNIWFTEL